MTFLLRSLAYGRRRWLGFTCLVFLLLLITWKKANKRRYHWRINLRPENVSPSAIEIDWLQPEPFEHNKARLANNTMQLASVSHNVHAFYYAWYNAPVQGQLPSKTRHWLHWNHRRLPYYIKNDAKQFSSDAHRPPDDIGANFYPKLGPYASVDPNVIRAHFRMASFAGIGVLVLSWYPAGMADDNGEPVDDLVFPLLNMASSYGMKLCLHIEPYKNRTAHTVVADVRYALERGYTTHPAYYRLPSPRGGRKPLPVFFVYDSYTVEMDSWASILLRSGSHSIRGKSFDAYMVGLLIATSDCEEFAKSGFDAGYTYFVGKSTTFASLPSSWSSLGRNCKRLNVHFYPSVGPGYSDTAIRPWNSKSTVDRLDGQRYSDVFQLAIASEPSGLGVTSFNEWGEGTQIEPSKPYIRPVSLLASSAYLDYRPYSSEFYLRLTRLFVNKYATLATVPQAFGQTTTEEKARLNQLAARTL